MRAYPLAVCLAVAVSGGGRAARAEQPPPPVPPPISDERLVLSGDGSRLTGGSGGGGASATWLHSFSSPGSVAGLGADYEQISNAHWTTANLSGSLGFGEPKPTTDLYAEVHEGAGDIGAHAFHYSLIAGGAFFTLAPPLMLQLEERRIDVDTTHGNLPKLGLAYSATPQLLLSASYAYSLGGNLGTRLATVRLDYHDPGLGGIGGVAWGPVAPAVVNLIGQVRQVLVPSPQLKEGFLGLTAPVGHTEWLLLGDYTDVSGLRRLTITLTCTVHLSAARSTS